MLLERCEEEKEATVDVKWSGERGFILALGVSTCIDMDVFLVQLRGKVAPGACIQVPPLGVLLPGDPGDDSGHEAVQRVVVTLNHRGGARQTRGELVTGAWTMTCFRDL